jgi:hypothetical protein
MDRTIHAGSCHCGALTLEFHSAKPLAPRACDCSFCRKHGARSVSDPDGHATIRSAAGRDPLRYRFGLKTADFLICSRCGVYVAAVIDIEGQSYSVLNLNTFEDSHSEIPGQPMSYEGESAEDRTERRRRVWTPTQILTS